MAGGIRFRDHSWASSTSKTLYVFEYLISRLPNGETKDRLRELVDEEIPLLDLRDPKESVLVDLIANDLQNHVESLEDATRRDNLTAAFSDLIEFAKEQQIRNARAQQ
jgi:hypothetical protein